MSDGLPRGLAPTGRALALGLAVAAVWVAWGLARHPGFQPVPWLRVAAPVIALLAGGGFARLVARARHAGERLEVVFPPDRGPAVDGLMRRAGRRAAAGEDGP